MKTKKKWFEDWFDTRFYHILYQHRNDAEAKAFIDALVQHLVINQQHNVLDLACGKGRHAIYLNTKNIKVTGLDLSSKSIAHAKIFENENLHFEVHDMRFPYHQKFDFIFNLFTSFGYFDDENDNQKAIDAMQSMLKENGILVIDFLNVHKAINNLIPYEEKLLDNILFKISKKIENQFIIKTITFDYENETYHFQEKVKILTLTDFENYFRLANLALVNVFGQYDLSAYDAQHSDRLILIVKKI
jgi:SAM-dependent methyltransferase